MAPELVSALVSLDDGITFFERSETNVIVRYDKSIGLIRLLIIRTSKDLDRYAHIVKRIVIRISEIFETLDVTQHKAGLILESFEVINVRDYPLGIKEIRFFRTVQRIQEDFIARIDIRIVNHSIIFQCLIDKSICLLCVAVIKSSGPFARFADPDTLAVNIDIRVIGSDVSNI